MLIVATRANKARDDVMVSRATSGLLTLPNKCLCGSFGQCNIFLFVLSPVTITHQPLEANIRWIIIAIPSNDHHHQTYPKSNQGTWRMNHCCQIEKKLDGSFSKSIFALYPLSLYCISAPSLTELISPMPKWLD